MKTHHEWAGARLRELSEQDCRDLHGFEDLQLPSNGFKQLPVQFADLSSWLVQLNLASNRFSLLPAALLALQGLRGLDLSANQLEELPTAMSSSYPHLTRLDLGDNELSDASAVSLNGMKALESLVLRKNNFSVLQLSNLLQLQTLDARDNSLSKFPSFSNLPSLVDVTLRGNQISETLLCLSELPMLTKLDLGNNNLESPFEIRSSRFLQEIDLGYNRLTTFPRFEHSNQIQELRLAHNQMRHLPEELINQILFPALKSLDLSENQLSEISSCVVQLMSLSLVELLVSYNRISELPQLPLESPAFCLNRFDFRGNLITFDIAKRLIELDFVGRLNLCYFYETVPQKILDDGMYLGSAEAARNVSVLERIGITHILNASMGRETGLFPEKFRYLMLQMRDDDTQDMDLAMETALVFIDDALQNGGKILLHCQVSDFTHNVDIYSLLQHFSSLFSCCSGRRVSLSGHCVFVSDAAAKYECQRCPLVHSRTPSARQTHFSFHRPTQLLRKPNQIHLRIEIHMIESMNVNINLRGVFSSLEFFSLENLRY